MMVKSYVIENAIHVAIHGEYSGRNTPQEVEMVNTLCVNTSNNQGDNKMCLSLIDDIPNPD